VAKGWAFMPSMRAELVEVPRQSPFDRLRAHNAGLGKRGHGLGVRALNAG
jgi:hypothetical protein